MPEPIEKLRPSDMTIFPLCPESAREPEQKIPRELAPAADLGSAVHDAMSAILDGDERSPDPPPAIDQEDFAKLVAYGMTAWKALSPFFPNRQADYEIEVDDDALFRKGHVDLVSLSITSGSFLDFKTGTPRKGHYDQLCAYAWMLFRKHPDLTELSGSLVYLREWTFRSWTFTPKIVGRWFSKISKLAAEPMFRPGSHCCYCKRRHECDAFRLWTQTAIATMESEPTDPLEPAAISELYDQAKGLEKLIAELKRAVKAHVMAHGRVLYLGNETALTVEGQEVRELDIQRSWPVLSALLPAKTLAECSRISITKVEKAVREAHGNNAVKKLRAKLDQENAIKINDRDVLKLVEYLPPDSADV